MSNPFLPSPPKWLTWPLDVCREVGYRWFYWFSLRIFSQTSLELEIFPPRYNGVRFFFSIIRHERYFFQCRMFFPRNLFACFFPPEISLQDIFFLKLSITPSKVKCRPLKSTKHLVSWHILICQSFPKAFETIGDKTLKGRIRFYLPLPGKSVRSYVRMDVRWRHNQIFSDR